MSFAMGSFYSKNIVASAARTTSSNATFTLPDNAIDACFVLDVSAASGTSPTLNVIIETSPDAGTTYFQCFRFAQASAASILTLRCGFTVSGQNTGTTATNANSGNTQAINNGTHGTISTGAFATGCPILPRYMRAVWALTATTPSFTFALWVWGNTAAREAVTS